MPTPAKTLCNIPEELLTKQLMIEAIPSVIILAILFISTVVCLVWWWQSRNALNTFKRRAVLVGMCIVFFPLWYKCSFIATKAATSVFNTEFAALQKFAEGCPPSMFTK
jgi:hypothetical protein